MHQQITYSLQAGHEHVQVVSFEFLFSRGDSGASRELSEKIRGRKARKTKNPEAIARSRPQRSVEAKATICVEEYAYFLPVLKPW